VAILENFKYFIFVFGGTVPGRNFRRVGVGKPCKNLGKILGKPWISFEKIK
jgi:hypothetical protein